MSAIDLVFSDSPASNSDILFGGGDAVSVPTRVLTLDGALPSLTADARVDRLTEVTGSASLPGLTLTAVVAYDNSVTRYIQGSAVASHQTGDKFDSDTDSSWGFSGHIRGGVGLVNQTAVRAGTDVQSIAETAIKYEQDFGSIYQAGIPVGNEKDSVHQKADNQRKSFLSDYQLGVPVGSEHTSAHQAGIPVRKLLEASRWQEAKRSGITRQGRSGASKRTLGKQQETTSWQSGQAPFQGRYVKPVQPNIPNGYLPSTNLLFAWPFGLNGPNIIFGETEPTAVVPPSEAIPVRGVYFVINSFSLKRVSNNLNIPVTSVGVSIDRDTWAWGFSATCPKAAKAAIDPSQGPVEIELEINGFIWRMLIERMSENLQFGNTNYSITGRSVTAQLDDPYVLKHSYIHTDFMKSRAFVEQILARPDAPAGFDVNWNLGNTDPVLGWGMPAKTYSYQDKTHMQAIKEIVEGVKGFVMSHPYSKTLIVRSRYPFMPWELSTQAVDIEVPNSIIRTRSVEMMQSPAYEGVYVSGESVGVARFVKRTGTSGATQPPMYVNRMVSDDDAAREAGRAILAASGRRSRVGIQMPLISTSLLMVPGTLIGVVDGGLGDGDNWKGWVNGLGIQANWNDGLSVTQSVDIERRYVESV